MSRPHQPRFAARPYVCGAVGAWAESVLRRLIKASPSGTKQIVRTGNAVLWASNQPTMWQAGEERGYYWWPLAQAAKPDSWRAAADRCLAAGLTLTRSTALLHTCALGVQEIYVRRHGDAIYFAVRIDPLLALDPTPLHMDVSAWAGILAMSCPMGDATPFQEVRRLTAATGWEASERRLTQVSFTPSWLATEPASRPDPRQVADALAGAITSHRRWSPFLVPLSGGGDSRLVAALTQRTGRRTSAWTTDPDDGTDRDLRLSKPVAEHLGLRHRVLLPDPDGWLVDRAETLERVQYQTSHHAWIITLAHALRRRRGTVLDGLAGDVLLKGSSFASDEVLDVAAGGDQLDAFWRRIAMTFADRPELLAPGLSPLLADESRSAFNRVTAPVVDHPAAINISQLLTRTFRTIAACPFWLLGPEADVRTPFLHPDVIRASLRPPAGATAGSAFFREVLRTVGGEALAALPSTNDPVGTPPERAPRRCQAFSAREGLISSITGTPEVHALLGPKLQHALTSPDKLDRMLRWHRPRSIILWADTLAQWRQRYADRLVWPPGLAGDRRRPPRQ